MLAKPRSAYLSKRGTVTSCLLAGPKDSLFGTMVITEELAPGSILCPITSEDQAALDAAGSYPHRPTQVRGLAHPPSEDGFKVTGLGHRRS